MKKWGDTYPVPPTKLWPCMWYVTCIILFILWPCRGFHNIVCSTAHTVYARNSIANCVHPNTVLKIKHTAFLYLPDMGSTYRKMMPCNILHYLSVQRIKHINEIMYLLLPKFCKLSQLFINSHKVKHEDNRNTLLIYIYIYISNVFYMTYYTFIYTLNNKEV